MIGKDESIDIFKLFKYPRSHETRREREGING